MSEINTIKVTLTEGGPWFAVTIHSLEMPRGAQWDALNGWRCHALRVMGETGNDGAADRRREAEAIKDMQLDQLEAVDARAVE